MEAVLSPENKAVAFLKSLDMTENSSRLQGLQEKIDAAKIRLLNGPLPNRKQEDWKYSKIAPFLSKEYKQARSNQHIDISRFNTTKINANLLVFVNGYQERSIQVQ